MIFNDTVKESLKKYANREAGQSETEKILNDNGLFTGDKLCCRGFKWQMYDDTSPLYRIDICNGGGHYRIILKKPPIQKAKKVELIKGLDGSISQSQSKADNNIFE